MLKLMPFALAGLVGIVVFGVGGYEPWATFVLEVSAVVLTGWVVASVAFETTPGERERNVTISRSQRGQLFGKRPSADVEITPPAGTLGEREHSAKPSAGSGFERFYIFGYPFRRTGVGLLALAITLWMGLSLVPLRASWLSLLSPRALSLRNEIEMLVTGDAITLAPLSVTPFLSYQDVLLWLAYLMVFWVTYHVAASSRAVRRLTVAILLVGMASGVYGLVQWLSIVGASLSDGAPPAGFMATGSFGNRNHYAFFQEMALLIGLGWLLLHWSEADRHARDRVSQQEAKARTGLFAIGVACIALSLVFSLSRSGITFAMAAVAALFFLSKKQQRDSGKPAENARPVLAGLALCLVTVTLWIGVDPVVSRFELVPQELRMDATGRTTVWRDSLGAVEDFWLTGSGLSSFQYVYPIYRSFGGRRFYSWAHNDYLQIAIELGLTGLILTGFIVARIVRRAYHVRIRLSAQPGWARLHAGYCTGAIAVGLHSFTDFGLHLPANALLFSIIIGVVTGLSPDRTSRRGKKKTRKKKLRRSPPAR